MSFDRREVAPSAICGADGWPQGAARALDDKRGDDVAHSSRMAVELSANAALPVAGMESPKQLDAFRPGETPAGPSTYSPKP